MTVQILLKYYNKCCLCIYYFRAHELCKSKIMFCYTKHRLVQMPTQDVSVLEMHVFKSIQGRAPWWRSNLYHGYHLPVVQYSCLLPEKLKKTQIILSSIFSYNCYMGTLLIVRHTKFSAHFTSKSCSFYVEGLCGPDLNFNWF